MFQGGLIEKALGKPSPAVLQLCLWNRNCHRAVCAPVKRASPIASGFCANHCFAATCWAGLSKNGMWWSQKLLWHLENSKHFKTIWEENLLSSKSSGHRLGVQIPLRHRICADICFSISVKVKTW